VTFVAVIARHIYVFPEQWKKRQAVVEENILIPRDFVVASLTLCALFTIMRIVIGMACTAIRCQWRFEYRLDMAVDTFDGFMGAPQCVVSVTRMIEIDGVPGHVRMAQATIGTEMPIVLIVFKVTGDAGLIQFV